MQGHGHTPDRNGEGSGEQAYNQPTDSRYAAVEVTDGTVIYNRDNPREWLLSDNAINLGDL